MNTNQLFANTKTKFAATGASLAIAVLALTGCGAGTSTTSSSSASASASSSASSSASASSSSTASASASASSSEGTSATISETAEAAQAFLALLSDEQKESVVYDYTDASKSTMWSNFPVTFVERSGLNIATDLNDEQKAAALKVLETLLNEESYTLVENIMNGDQHLLEDSNTTEDSLGQYNIAFFGDPSDTSSWSIQFGGHHLGFNADLNGEAKTITFAPTHLGSQPYSYTNSEGETITTMDGIYTDAFALYDSLTEEQVTTVYQSESVPNLTCAPGDTCEYTTGEGIKGSELTDEQKELMLELIRNYAGMADDETWEAQKAKIEATLDETYFSWSGATKYDTSIEGGIYFKISGPNVYIEFSGQGGSAGADVDGEITTGWGHVHSIYRDPTNDYAGSVEQGSASGPGGGAGAPGGDMGGGTPPEGGAPAGEAPAAPGA